MAESLRQILDKRSRPGELYKKLSDGRIECFACAHRCPISEGFDGVCKVRGVREGQLWVPGGYVAGLQIDPIEKKPFYHVLPGNDALSFGMLGCDLHCDYCQNWVSSQTLRDDQAVARPRDVTVERLIEAAEQGAAPVIVSTYNEPLITAEWGKEVFEAATNQGFLCGFVSNGNATPEVLDYLRPYVSLYKVDLKTFDDAQYRSLGAPLAHILKGIELIFERKFWLEIVTLIVPGLNDDEAQLRGIARFLADLSPDIPWHVTAYRPMYKSDRPATPASTLMKAAEIGREEGLRYIYCGNRPGQVGDFENTNCFDCGEVLIERSSFRIRHNHMTEAGTCPTCNKTPPGIWQHPKAQPRDPGASARPRSINV